MELIIEKINELLSNKKLVTTLLVAFGITVAVYIGVGALLGTIHQEEEPPIEYEEEEYDLSGDEMEIEFEDGSIANFGDELSPKNSDDLAVMTNVAWKSDDNTFLVFHPENMRVHFYKYNVEKPKVETEVTNYGYYDVMLAQNIMALAGDEGGHIEGEYSLNGDTLKFDGKTYKAYPLDKLVYFSFDMYGVGYDD